MLKRWSGLSQWIANDKADKAGRGAWTLDGKMIDVPIVVAARAMISKAKIIWHRYMECIGWRSNWHVVV